LEVARKGNSRVLLRVSAGQIEWAGEMGGGCCRVREGAKEGRRRRSC